MAANATPTPVMAVPGMPVLLPADVNVDLTVGAVVVSTWSSVFMFGMVAAAGYVYYMAFPRDRLAIKGLVTFCILLGGLDTISNAVWAYHTLVEMWGSIPGAGFLPHLYYVNAICCGVGTLIVQCFYAIRIWRMGAGNLILSAIIALCSVLQFAFVIYVVATWGKNVLISDVHTAVLPVGYGWGIAGLIGDVLITGALVRHLYTRGDSLTIGGFMSQIIQTNVLSLIAQLMTIVFFKIHAGMYFMLNDVVLAKIYCFSLLISLNARRSDTAVFNDMSHLTSHHSGSNNISLKALSVGRSQMPNPPLVRVSETVEVSSDSEWDLRDAQKRADV